MLKNLGWGYEGGLSEVMAEETAKIEPEASPAPLPPDAILTAGLIDTRYAWGCEIRLLGSAATGFVEVKDLTDERSDKNFILDITEALAMDGERFNALTVFRQPFGFYKRLEARGKHYKM